MTLALFVVLVFLASALVSALFPDILYPELAAERLASRSYDDPSYGWHSSSFGFGFGFWNFMTYDFTMLPEVVADFVRLAAATFLDIDIDVGKLFGVGQSSPSPPQRKPRGAAGQRYTSGRGPASKKLRTDSQGNVVSDRLWGKKSWLGRLVARFMLGLSTLGIVSFLQLAMSMSLFAPLQIARGAWFRRRRREGGGGGVEGAAGIMIAVFVLIGVVRCVCPRGSFCEDLLTDGHADCFWSNHRPCVLYMQSNAASVQNDSVARAAAAHACRDSHIGRGWESSLCASCPGARCRGCCSSGEP